MIIITQDSLPLEYQNVKCSLVPKRVILDSISEKELKKNKVVILRIGKSKKLVKIPYVESPKSLAKLQSSLNKEVRNERVNSSKVVELIQMYLKSRKLKLLHSKEIKILVNMVTSRKICNSFGNALVRILVQRGTIKSDNKKFSSEDYEPLYF